MNTPAFPVLTDEVSHMGMTLRDYFAGKVLQGLMSCGDAGSGDDQYIASTAYMMADAMLKERAK
jgi:hypothetical protein